MDQEPTKNPMICKDCSIEYELTEGETKFYEDMIRRDPTFVLPKRCTKCRSIKKQQRIRERIADQEARDREEKSKY